VLNSDKKCRGRHRTRLVVVVKSVNGIVMNAFAMHRLPLYTLIIHSLERQL